MSKSVVTGALICGACFLVGCGSNDEPGRATGGGGGGGGTSVGGSGGWAGSSGGLSGGGGNTSGGGSSSTGGSTSSGTGVWPGTSTRYFPGIYPLIRTSSHEAIQNDFDDWFGGVEDDYRERVGTTPVTYLGMSVGVEPSYLFSEHWQNSATAPFDWKTTCSRIAAAADPNAAPDGQQLYDYSWFETLLEQPFVQAGGKVVIRVMNTYTRSSGTPEWMYSEGYSQKTDGWSFSQMQDAAVIYMWQDMMTAFAKKFSGDSRIAAMVFDETYPSLWPQVELCGNLHGLEDAQAANAGLLEIAESYLDVDPDMLWTIVNWFSADDSPLATWEQGYDLGGGKRTPGADDLPGAQGHWRQDIKFWSAEGEGAPCTVDAPESKFMNFYLAQHAAVNFTGPVFVGNEANGWTSSATPDHRTGAENPWNADTWPDWDPAGSLPGEDDKYPSAAFWVWYTSGAPRAETATSRDSGLGQAGEDPCGVLPASFYVPQEPDWVPDNRPAWTASNLSIAKFRKAFDTFGPKGTKAMFHLPPGYLEQFQ